MAEQRAIDSIDLLPTDARGRAVGEEVRRLVVLAAPVVATQIGSMMLGVVDTMMVGRVGYEAVAAASLGNVWVMGALLGSMGIVLGIDPLVSQAHGARNPQRLGLALQQGLVVAALVSVPVSAALLFTDRGLVLLGQDPVLAAEAHRYALVQIPGAMPFLMFMACRQYLQGRGIVMPAMWVMLIVNVFNAGLNWVLVYGNLGAPALGVVGSGIATSITRWLLLIGIGAWITVRGLHRGGWAGWDRAALSVRRVVEVLRYGIPVAFQFSFEVWAFQVATLLAGRFGALPLAGHTVVLNLASLTFMMPLGISIGASTRVGNLIGERQPRRAQLSSWVAFGLGGGVMVLAAAIFLVARTQLPRMYFSDADVIAVAASLLPIAAAFQIFDGLQVVGGGVLRGMGRTVPAAVFNLVGYYVLALPIGAVFAFGLGLGVAGIWWGLAAGLAAVAAMLLVWIGVRGPAHVDARVL